MTRHRAIDVPRRLGSSNLNRKYTLRPTPLGHPADRLGVTRLGASSPPRSLPAEIDLRRWARPVRDQGSQGSCSGFAGCAARALLHGIVRQQTLPFDLAPAFLYFEERKLEGDTDRDAGASLGDTAHVLMTTGVCPEQDQPYVEIVYASPPPASAYFAAADWRLDVCVAIPVEQLSIRGWLAGRVPLVLGLEVYPSFEDTGPSGIVAVPDPKNERFLGGHAVCAMGYDARGLIIRNQWSTRWGDAGDCYLPWDFLPFVMEARAMCGDVVKG